jgi:exopolyphosphatase/guanosine-5'-triphosphate,3'-diphosphate pyrophosphatase
MAAAGAVVAAVLDVGSNSVLLLTLAVAPDGRARQRDAALATTRLGSGLRRGGSLDAAARARTRDAVVALARRARAASASCCWAFATGAARDARDGAAFAAELAPAADCAVEVLAGEEEARLAYASVAHALAEGDAPLLVADVGGATTEVTFGRGERIEAAASLPLGALTLTEAGGTVPAGTYDLVAAAAPVALARDAGAPLVASGGTATALAALDLGLTTYDPARVHGHGLVVDGLGTLAAGARPCAGVLDEGRAHILPAGAAVLAAVARAAGVTTLRVSEHGVRHAYLRRRLAREGIDADLRALWS